MNIFSDDVSVVIDGRTVVDDATLGCPRGAVTALVGPSGSGKTTLLHCLGLLQAPTRGRVLMDAQDTAAWTAARRRRFWRDDAAFVLQDYGIIEDESVAFSWIEWPDKAKRRAMMERMDEIAKTDERFDPAKNPVPFDGKRMIFGGFAPLVDA